MITYEVVVEDDGCERELLFEETSKELCLDYIKSNWKRWKRRGLGLSLVRVSEKGRLPLSFIV